VKHLKEWTFSGYNEIQNHRKRYGLIDYQKLLSLVQMRDLEELQESFPHLVEDAIGSQNFSRDNRWTESIAARPLKCSILFIWGRE